MKFITNNQVEYIPRAPFPVENFIHYTKEIIDSHLKSIFHTSKNNLSPREYASLRILRNSTLITIKPADKNLGIVILDTNDYVQECIRQLSSTTYRRVAMFPESLSLQLQNLTIKFKNDISQLSRSLLNYLTPSGKKRIPRFYGLPKIHKQPPPGNNIPPIRPIVSHKDSLLCHSAKFIDHILQPLARSYNDYLHNSTELVHKLSTLYIKEEVVLVSMDIISLFPSIPQSECIKVIHDEMYKHQELIISDPNFITQLLELNMYNNYFTFAKFTFHQTTGTTMGASYSPTVANIFMSVFFRKFFKTTTQKPLFFSRYIDDIFMIWPKKYCLATFLESLNKYHPNIKFTTTTSDNTIDFLDLTIFKGPHFATTQLLDTKTFQKPSNLYQYLHFNSFHPKSVFKGIIIGECIRYIRTNSQQINYESQIALLKQRLQHRNYPLKFINKQIQKVHYHNRENFIKSELKPNNIISKPIFKCPKPPRFSLLKKVVLENYHRIQKFIDTPLFVALKHKTLSCYLVKSKHHATEEDNNYINQNCKISSPTINQPRIQPMVISTQLIKPTTCKHSRCATCSHFNNATHFKSNKTNKVYKIRSSFSCSSRNIIYLITCKKCKKQYVGSTEKTLRERINHHRSTIIRKERRYISKHFNFVDHQITDLSVQIIDSTSSDKLHSLEQYWIKTLQTIIPFGLNCID